VRREEEETKTLHSKTILSRAPAPPDGNQKSLRSHQIRTAVRGGRYTTGKNSNDIWRMTPGGAAAWTGWQKKINVREAPLDREEKNRWTRPRPPRKNRNPWPNKSYLFPLTGIKIGAGGVWVSRRRTSAERI